MIKLNYLAGEEENLKALVSMVDLGDFDSAKNLADCLLSQGIPKTMINYSCHNSFNIIQNKSKAKAKKLAKTFKDYHWKNWLD